MQGGDISNETPRRLIVVIDTIIKSEVIEKKRVLLPTTEERKINSIDHLALSHLWTVANKYGMSIELAAFETDLWTEVLVTQIMEKLDKRGTNPFNYSEVYSDINDFIDELPYRPNLVGIVDVPGRVARYGSKGIELYNL